MGTQSREMTTATTTYESFTGCLSFKENELNVVFSCSMFFYLRSGTQLAQGYLAALPQQVDFKYSTGEDAPPDLTKPCAHSKIITYP